MPSVLITGASGFIGSFLVAEGLARNFDVFAAVRPSSSRKWLTDPRIRFVEMDTGTPEAIEASLAGCRNSGVRFDFIIHNAGVTKVRRKEDFLRVNRDTTIHLIRALKETCMTPGKFLFMSSLAAWGPGDPVTMKPVSLTDPPHPAGLYGQSKLKAEEYIKGERGLKYIILRPTGVYGPREQDYFTIYKAIRSGLEPYLGSRDQVLTFIYVKDLARVAFDALLSPLDGKAWFVSDGKEYTAGEFAGVVKSILNKKTISITFPLPVVRMLAGVLEGICSLWNRVPLLNLDKYYILSSKNWKCDHLPLYEDLSFRPEYDLRKGLEETMAWCREHHLL
jgi:nucleoside-diphosphate-sugar epimerase